MKMGTVLLEEQRRAAAMAGIPVHLALLRDGVDRHGALGVDE